MWALSYSALHLKDIKLKSNPIPTLPYECILCLNNLEISLVRFLPPVVHWVVLRELDKALKSQSPRKAAPRVTVI